MKRLEINRWDRFWYLEIIEEIQPDKRNNRYFKCKCICWKILSVRLSHLRDWQKSCWCIKEWKLLKMSETKFWRIYYWIRTRCYNKNCPAYKNYWWRWIKCEWNNLRDFYNDMYDNYKKAITSYWEKISIERINVNWNYCKNNCKWIPLNEQYKNKRSNRYFYNWQLLTDYCRDNWLDINVIINRIRNLWWSIEKSVNTPIKKPKLYFWKTLWQRAKILNIPRQTLYSRIIILWKNPRQVLLNK